MSHMQRFGKAGFTLIEVMISVVIISIAMVTLLAAFGNGYRLAANSGVITASVMLADEKLTMLSLNLLPRSSLSEWMEDERYPTLQFRSRSMATQFQGAVKLEVEVRHDGKKIISLVDYASN